MAAADRNALSRALKAAGIVRVVLYADRGWLAETLHRAGGFVHADEDDRQALEDGTQALLDLLIQAAKNEQTIRVSGEGGDER